MNLLSSRLLFGVLYLVSMISAQQQFEIGDAHISSEPLEQFILQNQQISKQQQLEKRRFRDLPPWIIEELRNIKDDQVNTELQNFSFQMSNREGYEFKWNPSKIGNLYLKVTVFQMIDNEIVLFKSRDQDKYLSIFTKMTEMNGIQEFVGNVYCIKSMPILVHGDYILISFKKNFDQNIFVDIDLESTGRQVKTGVKDSSFHMDVQKSQTILQQLQDTQRKHRTLFIEEYSLSQRQQKHMSQMLIITGVEMIAILVTCLVQIYSIKNLIDNRTIV